jgi:iron(III) transport system substrate-binding protein
MRRGCRRAVAAWSALALLVALAGCGGSGRGSIVLYNGQHAELTRELVDAFEKQSGISVRIRTSDSVVLANQILQEGHDSPADVYISENSPELMTLEQHGLLAKLSPSILSRVPARDSSPNGDWVGMALRVSSLAYDPAALAPRQFPKSILALALPRWKGKIAVAPTDSDFPPLVGAVVAAYGEKKASTWLAGLKRNARTYQDEEAVAAAVDRGDVASGLVNQYYWYRLRLELGAKAVRSRLYYFPSSDVGSITNVSGAAVLESSGRRKEAETFVGFLVSLPGQRLIARGDDFEYPARPGVRPNRALPPLSSIAHAAPSVVAVGANEHAATLIRRAGLL